MKRGIAAVACAVIGVAATGLSQTRFASRDLEGIWGFATLTPLERPAELAAKSFLSDDEAAAYVKQTLERGDRDRRDGGAAVDVARAVNDHWFDRGTGLARYDGKAMTSMLVAPADGAAATPMRGPGRRHELPTRASIPQTAPRTGRCRSAAWRSTPGRRFSPGLTTTSSRSSCSRTTPSSSPR